MDAWIDGRRTISGCVFFFVIKGCCCVQPAMREYAKAVGGRVVERCDASGGISRTLVRLEDWISYIILYKS